MTATYKDFRIALETMGFELVRSKKHETWQKVLTDGTILQVRVSHQKHRDIPKALFHKCSGKQLLPKKNFKKRSAADRSQPS